MNQEEQRIAIAEACGWKTGYRDPEAWHPLPDYLNDLNAMHEAEKTLWKQGTSDYDPLARRRYYHTLDQLTGDQWDTITATATQRAEAFLKALNLWKS